MKIKNMLLIALCTAAMVMFIPHLHAQPNNLVIRIYKVADFGLKPNSKKNASPAMDRLLKKIKAECKENDSIVIRFEKGTYNFHPKGATERTYYISNHDQTNPKKIGIALEDFKHLTIEGDSAMFIFHGQMLPLSLMRSAHCTLRNFSIDFANPHIAQVTVTEQINNGVTTIEPAPWVSYRITPDSLLEVYGNGWQYRHNFGIAFEEKTKHLIYNTSDCWLPCKGAYKVGENRVAMPSWKNDRLIPGTRVVLRGWERPAPGMFLANDLNTTINNVQVHYAEGMGLLAQLCENITLNEFSVCLKGDTDPRYFTTQADATHFSSCKGKIISCNGLYEGMMDDAINVHGTYLKVVKRINEHTLVGRYMHEQTWGFEWGNIGDVVQFVRSATMELTEQKNRITNIQAYDTDSINGAREFIITFEKAVEPEINDKEGFGIENLTWTPKVYFANNVIRNNRARGALFSTPRKTIVENNLFDHTSGTAILLCGDCNGWFETGACHDVQIRKNKFVNALTSMFQFTEGVISIYPEIPELEHQQKYFHGGKDGGIIIEENDFEMFDMPLLYAKSVDGLIFRNNTIRMNHSYKPFHKNKSRFKLERVTNIHIAE